MRRPIVIIIGFIVLAFVILIVLFGLKGPEMPIQEVHKNIPMSKLQQQVATPVLPAVSVPANNIQPTQSVNPAVQVPQPGTMPNNAVGNATAAPALPAVSVPANNIQPTQPVNPAVQAPQSGIAPNAARQPQAPSSTVPLIIPQPNANATSMGQAVQQPLAGMPQPGAVPGNAAGVPAQH